MMNRLEKKCVIASTAFHTLLLGILLFGSALMPGPDQTSFKPITVYSAAAVSEAMTSGGSPDANIAPSPVTPPAPPAENPPTPKPVVQPPVAKAQVEPVEPPKPVRHETPKPPVERVEIPKDVKIPNLEKVKPVKVKPEPKEVVEAPKPPHKILLDKNSSKIAVRKSDEKAKAAQEAAEWAANDARRKTAKEIASSYRNISKNLSSSTAVAIEPGNGAPGALSVNYRGLIASKYYNAWSAPADVDDSTPPVGVSVTIDRNGNVKSAHIVKSSGNKAMDRSIINVLEAVTFFEPFPASIKEQEMTVDIKFNILGKRGTG